MLRLAFLLILCGVEVSAQTTLLAKNSIWKYKADGTDQGSIWRNASFNDSNWPSGPTEMGFGDSGEATVIGQASNGYITFYFRKKIKIDNPTQFCGIDLKLWRDDGAVVYLNNTEVWRSNMPSGTIGYLTPASGTASDDGNTAQVLSLPTSAFVNDTNTIAVEIHQASASSSDVSFNFEIIGQSNQITRGPYWAISDSLATVRWRTSCPTDSRIVIGNQVFTDITSTTEHIVHLRQLIPNTAYTYQIGSTTQLFPNDTNYHIHTTPLRGTYSRPIEVIGFGDFGVSSIAQDRVEKALPQTADVWQWYGDNAYSNGTAAEYEAHVFGNHYKNHFPKLNLMPSRGNHDGGASSAANQTGPYFEYFFYPTQGQYGGVASNTKAYYAYTIGHTHHIVLESYEAAFRTTNGAMANWLRQDLQADTSRWRIVYFHHPPFSKGSHNSDTEADMAQMRQNIVPILEEYDVDVVLSGHSHGYERTWLIHDFNGTSSQFNDTHVAYPGQGFPSVYEKNKRGTVYAVVGTGGISLGGAGGHKAMAFNVFNKFGYAQMTISRDSLWFKFIDTTRQVIDQFIIRKSLPCPQNQTISNSTTHQAVHLSGAQQSIISTKPLSNNTQIWYSAGKSVELHPGFQAPVGAQFRAFVEGCDPP